MLLRPYLELFAQRIVDLGIMLVPRKRPSLRALRDCKIVAHRGAHDNVQIKENTMAAFAAIAAAGIWGIEFDLRWTRDLQPVVIHDTDTRRVFGTDLVIADVNLQQLQQRIPEIPSLAQVVQRFGGGVHLMVELKHDLIGNDARKTRRLQEIFAPLTAGVDYHFLALQPDLLDSVRFAGDAACLLVAEWRIRALSQHALGRGMAGICGQYLILNNRLLRLHHAAGQRLGTGFAASRFGFYRELNRGVDWIFTDHALKLGRFREELLKG